MILGKKKASELFVGDIAGNLSALLALRDIAPKGIKIIGLGDLNDRGPDSKGVFDFFMNPDNNAVALKGNHEHLMLDFLTDGGVYVVYNWLIVGGLTTIYSFCTEDKDKKYITNQGSELMTLHAKISDNTLTDEERNDFDKIVKNIKKIAKDNVEKKYIDWLKGLPIIYETENIIATHAPINPRFTLEELVELTNNKTEQSDNTLLWNRSGIEERDKVQIFGHQNHKEVTFYKTDDDKTWGMCVDTCKGSKLSAYCGLTDSILSVEL